MDIHNNLKDSLSAFICEAKAYFGEDLDLAWLMNNEPKAVVDFDTVPHSDIHPYGRTIYLRHGILTRALPEKQKLLTQRYFILLMAARCS